MKDMARNDKNDALMDFSRGSLERLARVKVIGDFPLAAMTSTRAVSMYRATVDNNCSAATHRGALMRRKGLVRLAHLAGHGEVQGRRRSFA
jgi:hypothetical protein